MEAYRTYNLALLGSAHEAYIETISELIETEKKVCTSWAHSLSDEMLGK